MNDFGCEVLLKSRSVLKNKPMEVIALLYGVEALTFSVN
jgi:hypothetical protein